VRRGGFWAKQMRLKQGAIGNTLGKRIGKLTLLHVSQVSNLSSFILRGGDVYLLLVACMPAFVPQNRLGLTHSKFLTHLAWIVQPHEYLKKSVDLDNSDFKLPRDLEE